MLEKARFFRQFAALLNAGYSVSQSLSMAGKRCSDKFQRYLSQASTEIDAGKDLATALRTNPPQFDPWTLSLLRSAEASGALIEVCERLAVAVEMQHQRQKLYRSVALSTGAILLCTLALLLFVASGGTGFLVSPIFWLIGLILTIAPIVATILGSTSKVSQTWHSVSVGIPPLKDLEAARSMVIFSELELPLRCGLSILQGVDLVRPRIPDPELAKALSMASRQIRAGNPLSDSLQDRIPAHALQMLRTGEAAGKLDEMLRKIGEYYQDDLESRLKGLQGMLRPIGVVAMGILVLFAGGQLITSLISTFSK